MIINVLKRKFIGQLSPHRVLLLLYVTLLVTAVGLYRWLPFSPVLMSLSTNKSEWSHQPISCWDQLVVDDNIAKGCEPDDEIGNIFLFGDSHAQQLVFGFERLKKDTNRSEPKKLIFLTSKLMRGNWRSPNFYQDPQVKFIRSVLSETTKNDVVLFSITSGHLEDSVYGNLMQADRLQVDLSKLMASIFYSQPVRGKIVLMLDTPHLENDVARICSNTQKVNAKLCTLKFDGYERQNSHLLGAYSYLKLQDQDGMLNLNIVNPMPLFCKSEVCSLFDESGFMLIDGNHIKMSVSHKVVEGFLLEHI